MGWAAPYKQELREGKIVSFRPRGNSMSPRIKSGQLVTVEPIPVDCYGNLCESISLGDVVLCNVKGNDLLHLVSAINFYGPASNQKNKYLITNLKGRANGWIPIQRIYGKVISVSS